MRDYFDTIDYNITTSMDTNKAIGIRVKINDTSSTYPVDGGQVTFKLYTTNIK